MRGAATITATYQAYGVGRFQVFIRPKGAPRLTRIVDAEQEAIDLVQHFNRLGLAGVDLAAALAEAKSDGQRFHPPLREVLGTFLNEQVQLGNIRKSTAEAYRGCLRRWVGLGPRAATEKKRLGDAPWNLVTREEIGALVLEIRKAGKSRTTIAQTIAPLASFYAWQIHLKKWAGVNPADGLKHYMPKRQKKKKGDYQWFRQDEALTLLDAAQADYPRWYAFFVLSFAIGTRWGETAALVRDDVDWKRGRVHVQRTWSDKGRRLEDCKDHEDRWVKVQLPWALDVLREHLAARDREAATKKWGTEPRCLVFPNTEGRIPRYCTFLSKVWEPLLEGMKDQLPYRSLHATRHSYATWLLEAGADLRYVRDQLGHASIEETEGTYGHLQYDRHEAGDPFAAVTRPPARQSASMAPGGAVVYAGRPEREG